MSGLGRRIAAAVLALPLLAAGGCGGGGGGKPNLIVSAAASLKSAFTSYGAQFTPAKARFSFAGSDQLAAQIQHGVRPDVFASANLKLPNQLYAAGLVEKPVLFATNRLVLAVPAGTTKVASLSDLARPGVSVVMGSPSVPIGAYTRQVLSALGAAQSTKILANVRSNEPDVTGVVGKLAQGAADAGFVYITDVKGSGGRLQALELPPRLRPRVAYGVALVRGTEHAAPAREFIAGLLSGRGQSALRRAGFEPPTP